MATELRLTEEYIERIRAKQPEMVVVDFERSKRTLKYLGRVLSALKRQGTYRGTWK